MRFVHEGARRQIGGICEKYRTFLNSLFLADLHGKRSSFRRPQQSSGEDVAMPSNGGAEMGTETSGLEEVTSCILWTRGGGELSYAWLELAAPQIYDFTLHHNA